MKYKILTLIAIVLLVIVSIVVINKTIDSIDKTSNVVHIEDDDETTLEGTQKAAYITLDDLEIELLSLSHSEAKDTLGRNPQAIIYNDSAISLLGENQLEAVVSLLAKAISMDSAYARAHYNIAVVYQRKGKINKAIRNYKMAIDLRPNYYNPTYNLGLLFLSIREFESALDWFTRAADINRSMSSAPTHYNLGLVYRRLGRHDEAKDSYKQAIRLQPNYTRPRYNLGLLLMNDGEYEEAASEFKKVAALGLRKAKLYNNLGVCYSKIGAFNNAMEAYREATSIDTTVASVWFNLAIVLNRAERQEEAIESYKQAIKLDSSLHQAYFNLAKINADLGYPDSAVVYYRQAINLLPNFAKAYYNLGLLYYRSSLYDSAATYFNTVIELDTDNLNALYNLALVYTKQGKLDEAIKSYLSLIDKDPVHLKGLTNLGLLYLDKKIYDRAVRKFSQLVQLTQSAEAYFNRARGYQGMNLIEEARNDYHSAIDSKPDYAIAFHNLALLEERDGNNDLAIDHFKRAIATRKATWRTRWQLGQIYVDKEMFDLALQEYKTAASDNPNSKRFDKEYKALLDKQ